MGNTEPLRFLLPLVLLFCLGREWDERSPPLHSHCLVLPHLSFQDQGQEAVSACAFLLSTVCGEGSSPPPLSCLQQHLWLACRGKSRFILFDG